MIGTIVTHVSPDWDAITSVWLLQRYGGFESAGVVFVNTGSPDPAALAAATAVADTGKVFDPSALRFDHHQLPGKAASETCAALQVWEWLQAPQPEPLPANSWRNGRSVVSVCISPLPDATRHLEPLVRLVYDGDTGKPGAKQSRELGIHALLSAQKAARWLGDHGLLAFGFDLLDMLASQLLAQADARASLAEHTVYTSQDGLVVALYNAPPAATFAAQEAGARLVVFADYAKNAIGIMRGGEGADVHAGELVARAETFSWSSAALRAELATWFRHEAGFFAGRGTAKAPSATPILVSLVDVACAIDTAWVRK